MDYDELTPEQRFAMEDPARNVHFDLSHGRSREEIIADLVRFGYSHPAAQRVIDRAAKDLAQNRSPKSRVRLLRAAEREMFGGLIVAILAVCFGTMTLVSGLAIGGYAIFPYGLALIGLAFAARGYTRWVGLRKVGLSPPETEEGADGQAHQ